VASGTAHLRCGRDDEESSVAGHEQCQGALDGLTLGHAFKRVPRAATLTST
jgi:hypothetical protein